MQKPIVLKRRLRLFDWHNGALILVAALWAWQYARDATAALIWLPGLIFINGNAFFRRVVLANDRITIYERAIYGDAHRFERIINYSLKKVKRSVEVEVLLQQQVKRNIEIFGTELNLDWRVSRNIAGIRERLVSFSIEAEHLDVLLTYLHSHGTVLDEIAAMWKENDLSSRVRALTERDDLPEDEAKEILREIEERLTRLKKY